MSQQIAPTLKGNLSLHLKEYNLLSAKNNRCFKNNTNVTLRIKSFYCITSSCNAKSQQVTLVQKGDHAGESIAKLLIVMLNSKINRHDRMFLFQSKPRVICQVSFNSHSYKTWYFKKLFTKWKTHITFEKINKKYNIGKSLQIPSVTAKIWYFCQLTFTKKFIKLIWFKREVSRFYPTRR